MEKRKIVKVITVLLMLIFFINSNAIVVNALSTESIFQNDQLKDISGGVSGSADSGIFGVINTLIGLLQIAGTGISLIMISVLGIKYLLASVEEKAEIKKTAMPVVIGAVLLFGAVNLAAIIENFASSVINS